MKKTFVDVMLELPVDATLRDFLTSHGLPVPHGFAWDDTPETSQFLVEAISLSTLGGLAGIAAGILTSALIAKFAGWTVRIGVGPVAVAFLFSALVGVFFGFYPARKAAYLDPIEALRHE